MAKRGPERATETRQYDLLRPNVGQKEPPKLGSTICYGQELARKSHQDSAVRFVTAKRGPERASKIRQYDLLRPRVGQKEPPRLGSTICYGQELSRKSHQDSAVRFVTAKSWPERATKTRQYDFLRPNVGQKEPPKLGSTICYGQELARKSHQDSAVRFVTAKRGPERATKTRQYDLLRPRVDQKEPPRLGSTICYGQELSRKSPPRLGSTICYGQELARKSHRDSAVRFVTAKRGPERATKTRQYRFVTAKSWPERATKTRQYDLLRPNVGQKEPPKLGSTICYGQELARKSHQDSAVRFVTAKRGPERATKTRQYDLLRPRVGQQEPPRLGSTICYGQELARKSHQDSAVRFVTAKRGPERATKTRQYDLLRGQTWARKSHQNSAVRFVTAKSWPDRATKTRQYDLLRPNVGQKEPPRLGSTICYGQTWARKSHQNSAVRFVTAKSWPEKATKTRQYDLLRPNVGQKEPPKLGSTICYGQELARKKNQDSAVRFVTAQSCPERATKTRQYDLLRPRVGQKEPPRLGSTICCGQTWARKSHQDSAVRFVTAKRGPERATKTRQYDLLRPRVGQIEPPRLGSTICYGQTWARKSHQDSAVRFVSAKRGPERATKTRHYDLLRPRVGQKEPPRLGSTICYGQTWARKSHQNSAVRFVTANRGPERATETRQYDLLRPNVGQKEPPKLGSTICYGQELASKSHQDSAVRFVTAKRGPERATKTRQYDLLRPRVGQKEPPRLGSTICYGQTWARKSHQDSAVRFVTAKSWPERATKTRQYDLLRPRVVQKEPPRLGSTICYGQELARKSHQDSAVRFVKAKRGPERATKTRQYDLLRPRVGQKEPPRLGSTICCGQTWARKSHQDSAVRFVTAKRWPERATKTRQYDLLRPRVGQKEPPRLGSTICYGQTWARKSHQNSAVRFVTAKSWPERATKTRQYDLLRPRVGQKEPPRLGSTICYGQELARKSHQDSAVRFVTAKRGRERATKTRQYDLLRPRVGQKEPPRLGSTICYGQTWARKSHQNSAVRFVTAKSWPDRATKTRQYDLLRPNVGQKEPPRLGSTICYGQTWARKSHLKLGSTICYGQELARKSHQDSAVRFVTAKRGPERATKTRQYDLLRPRVGQKEPPRLGSTICYGQELSRKSHQDSAVRFVTAKSWPERATKTRQYDLLRPNVGQKEPPKFGSTICYGQELARKSHQDSAVRFVTAKRGPERATKTRQYDLLRPRVGQKEPPRLGSTICYGQELSRKSHQDSAVRFVTAKSWPERATKTRQYDLLRPNVGQKEPPRLGSTICYGQELARKSHQDSEIRFVTAKRGPERATKIRQYDLLRPRVGQIEPPRLGSTICYGQTWARKSHRDSAVRFVTAKRGPERATKIRQYDLLRPRVGQKEPPKFGSTICYGQELARKSHQSWAKRGPERATKTRQYDLLRPNVGQKEPPRLGSTICYGQTWARKSNQNSAVRFVTAKSWPERATKTRQYDLLRPNVGEKEPPKLGSTICYGQELARKSHQDSAVRFVTAKRGPNVGQKEPPKLGSTICYGQTWARKSHQDSAVRFVTAKRGPERATKTRQYDLLRPRVGQKEPPRLGSTICYGQTWARKSHQNSAVRFVTAKTWPKRATKCPERATKTRQYDLLRPNVGQKEPPRLGSTICYGQTWARKSHQDSAVRFVTAKRGPERATKTRQYDLLRPRVGQIEPPRLGSTICYGQTWARKSHRDSAVRFVTAKRGPERATKTRQYGLLRPRVGQKEPPRLGSTICYGQTWARKSHQNSAVRFVTAKSWPERTTKTRQYDLLRPRVVQKEPPRLGSTICYGQELARKSHQDSAVRFVTAKRGPERATKTRQYDLLRPRVGQKEPPKLGSTICYGQTWARKSHQNSAVRFVTVRKNHQDSAVRFVTAKSWPERATKTRQYDLLRPRVGQKEPPRLGSTICYGQTWARKSHQNSAVRFVTAKSWPERAHQDSAIRLVTAKRGPERATKTRQYDLLRPNVGQKEPPKLGSTICYGQELARKSHQDSAVRFVTAKRGPERATKTRQYDLLRPRVGQKEPPRLGSTICYGQTWARKSHQNSAVRFVTAKSWPERATKTRQYDLLRPNVGQKEPPRLGSTICYGQTLARKSHQNSAARFVTAKSWPERATKTRQYDLLRPNVGQKEPPKLGSTICYGQELARKNHQDSAVRFVTAKSCPERATKTRQYDLLRPNVGQKEPPRLGSTICYGQTWARKSHQNSAVRFVTAKSWPERATKTRQYDLLRPNVGQKEPPKLGSTICYGQTWARKSHRDSAVRFVTAKRGPERATKTRQYDLLRPRVGQKEPPRLGSTICYGQTWARKSHQNSAVRFVTAKSWPERATKTRQYDLLRPNVGQKEPPKLGSTICYGQTWARKSHQDSAVRFVTAKRGPERATKTRQYDLLRPRVGQKEPPRLGSTICYGQTWARKSHQNSAVRFVTAKSWPERATKTRQYDLLRPNVGQKEPPRLGSTICYGQTWARKSHQNPAVRFVTAKSWPERATKTRQYDLLRPNVGQKEPPKLGSTICYGQELAR